MECGMRPSRMWTFSTPPWMASTHPSILGIMPPEMTPCSTSSGTSSVRRTWMRLSSSPGFRRSPRTSVRRISFSAFSASASLAAAVSALML